MWHVDEGLLHAYLDGALDEYPAGEARRVRAHLETCGSCAERLAAERRVRDDAQEILSLAAPRVEIPTLEELRAYVKSQGSAPDRARSRLHRLTWAASVMLALGTGWLLRGGLPPTTPTGARLSEPGAEATSEASEAAAAAGQEASAERPIERGPAADAPATPVGATSEPDVADAVATRGASTPAPTGTAGGQRAGTVVAGGQAPAGTEPAEDAATGAAPAIGSTTLADASPVVAGRTDAATGEPVAKVAPDSATGPVVAGFGPPAVGAVPEDAAVVTARTLEPARPDDSSRDEAAARRTTEQRVQSAIAQGPALDGLGAISLTRGRDDGEPARGADPDGETDPVSLVVPGLEVLDVLRIGEGTTFLGTRALQRLATGDTLETAHLPAGVETTVLPPLRTGWSELIHPMSSGSLVMRAPVPPDELLDLLRRLTAER